MPIIEVKHLTKEYNLGTLTSIKDTVRLGLARLTGTQTWKREKFKALDDVDFSIEKGEVVGIIGHNGAGKSTLLKHLACITNPTNGEVIVRGSVAPLIEVGAGVNPELTGRENIYLNGAILGIPKKTTNRKMDEIIEFSELSQFIDTPVKRYSSGMTVKLGFSIATSMDADILIIDEVLAVGDLAFQRKCFDRMENMIKIQGKTVLLVSHNIRQVERLCSRVIMLDNGCITHDSTPTAVCRQFYSESNKKITENSKSEDRTYISHTGDISLDEIIIKQDGVQTDSISYGKDIAISLTFKVNKHFSRLRFGIGIHTTDFLYLCTNHSDQQIPDIKMGPGLHTVTFTVNEFPFLPGVYAIRAGVSHGNLDRILYYGENLISFQVKNGDLVNMNNNNEGFVSLRAVWEVVER